MALVKTNYGLVYNDDGSLCVTLRDDDVPIPGVKSFAVEERTTNLHPDPENLNAFHGYTNKWRETSETLFGMKVFEWVAKDGTYQQYIGINQDYLGNWVGKTITFSVYYYTENLREVNPNSIIYVSSYPEIIDQRIIDVGNGWKRKIITVKINVISNDFWVNPFNATSGTIKFAGFQIEEKPFPTSFVDGTRPNGTITFPVSIPDAFVISFWTKMTYDPGDGSYYYLSLADISDVYNFAFNVGVRKNYPITGWNIAISTRKDGGLTEISAQIPEFQVNKWYFVTVVYTGTTAKIYFDGQLKTEQAIALHMDLKTNLLKINQRQYWTNEPKNGMIANLYIGEYDPAVWTDEYIKELYNMKQPFNVPPKMPII